MCDILSCIYVIFETEYSEIIKAMIFLLLSKQLIISLLKGEFTDFLKFNTTLGHIYTSHFTIKTPSDRFRMAVMAQNVVLFCTLLSLHKEKTRTTNIK